VTPLNLSFPKKFKTQKKKSQSCVKIVKLPIKKLLVLKKKVKTQQKNHIAVLKLMNRLDRQNPQDATKQTCYSKSGQKNGQKLIYKMLNLIIYISS
jgi:hypothetical protein